MLFIVSLAAYPRKIADEISDSGAFFCIEWKWTHHVHGRNPDTRRHETVDHTFTQFG